MAEKKKPKERMHSDYSLKQIVKTAISLQNMSMSELARQIDKAPSSVWMSLSRNNIRIDTIALIFNKLNIKIVCELEDFEMKLKI